MLNVYSLSRKSKLNKKEETMKPSSAAIVLFTTVRLIIVTSLTSASTASQPRRSRNNGSYKSTRSARADSQQQVTARGKRQLQLVNSSSIADVNSAEDGFDQEISVIETNSTTQAPIDAQASLSLPMVESSLSIGIFSLAMTITIESPPSLQPSAADAPTLVDPISSSNLFSNSLTPHTLSPAPSLSDVADMNPIPINPNEGNCACDCSALSLTNATSDKPTVIELKILTIDWKVKDIVDLVGPSFEKYKGGQVKVTAVNVSGFDTLFSEIENDAKLRTGLVDLCE